RNENAAEILHERGALTHALQVRTFRSVRRHHRIPDQRVERQECVIENRAYQREQQERLEPRFLCAPREQIAGRQIHVYKVFPARTLRGFALDSGVGVACHGYPPRWSEQISSERLIRKTR